MLKVRLMGTKNDIVWFQKILQRHPKVEVLEMSSKDTRLRYWMMKRCRKRWKASGSMEY